MPVVYQCGNQHKDSSDFNEYYLSQLEHLKKVDEAESDHDLAEEDLEKPRIMRDGPSLRKGCRKQDKEV